MNNKIDFRKLVTEFLQTGVHKQTAKDLKESFGIPIGTATKGILLISALFDLAVNKGSVPAAKELITLSSGGQDHDDDTLTSLISVLKEEE